MFYWLPIVVLFFLFNGEMEIYFGERAYDVHSECVTEAKRMLAWHRENRIIPGAMFYESTCARINPGKGIDYGGPRPDLTDSRT